MTTSGTGSEGGAACGAGCTAAAGCVSGSSSDSGDGVPATRVAGLLAARGEVDRSSTCTQLASQADEASRAWCSFSKLAASMTVSVHAHSVARCGKQAIEMQCQCSGAWSFAWPCELPSRAGRPGSSIQLASGEASTLRLAGVLRRADVLAGVLAGLFRLRGAGMPFLCAAGADLGALASPACACSAAGSAAELDLGPSRDGPLSKWESVICIYEGSCRSLQAAEALQAALLTMHCAHSKLL